jgi:hypothetical protein
MNHRKAKEKLKIDNKIEIKKYKRLHNKIKITTHL